jgi:decaprenylphospho-beta-D-erythro-pentofuranosid-2-ulose 2-reductase
VNDAFGRPQSVVVLGGTSDIAGAALDMLIADRSRQIVLAGRDSVALEVAAARLRAGGAERVQTVVFDATEPDSAEAVVGRSFAALDDDVDLVLVAVGALGEQSTDEVDPGRVTERITVNFTWPAAAMTAAANRLRPAGHGRIVVISSVAGVRVRRANFVYGSAKTGLDGFAQGLGEALRGSGVRLHVVRPGFVFTKMTAGRSPAPFAIGPAAVAAAMLKGIERDEPVIWVPSGLRFVFTTLRHLPRSAWRRLRE